MPMATFIIWWTAIVLEAVMVFRGLTTGLAKKFPFFFVYLSSVLCCDVLLYCAYEFRPALYHTGSRDMEFLNLILGYGIVLEIFRHVLSHYPGAEKFARVAGTAVFAAILGFALVYPAVSSGNASVRPIKVAVEKDFLTVQAVFFLGILGVIFYYGLPLGRNIKGIILGYGVWLGASLMTLTLRSYIGSSFNSIWIVAQPFSYLLSLFIWLTALWSYGPNPVASVPNRLEADYGAAAAATRNMMGAMRSHMGRAARP
jgi:hypothetical protein